MVISKSTNHRLALPSLSNLQQIPVIINVILHFSQNTSWIEKFDSFLNYCYSDQTNTFKVIL